MTLESLLVSLGLTEHMEALSNWRDQIYREKAEELQAVRLEASASAAAIEEACATRMGAMAAEHAAEISVLKSAQAEAIALMRAEHAAALTAATASPDSPLLSDLDTAVETLVPAEMQAAFEPAWVTVRNLIQAGKTARAAAFVRGLPVPDALVATRAQIADLIDGGE